MIFYCFSFIIVQAGTTVTFHPSWILFELASLWLPLLHESVPCFVTANLFFKMESKSRRVMQQPDDLTNIEFETSEDVNVIPTFDSMGLREDLLRGIYAYGM